MNIDDGIKLHEVLEKLHREGKVPYGVDNMAMELSTKPIPEVLAILLFFKQNGRAAGDSLCEAVVTSLLLSYCEDVDGALAMVNRVRDSLARFDKTLNQ